MFAFSEACCARLAQGEDAQASLSATAEGAVGRQPMQLVASSSIKGVADDRWEELVVQGPATLRGLLALGFLE